MFVVTASTDTLSLSSLFQLLNYSLLVDILEHLKLLAVMKMRSWLIACELRVVR